MKKPRLHGPKRDARRRGDFLQAGITKKPQDENLPLLGRKSIHAPPDPHRALVLLAGFVGGSLHRLQATQCLIASLRTQTKKRPQPRIPQGLMMSAQENGMQPCRKPATPVKADAALPRLRHRFLHEILCKSLVATKSNSPGEQTRRLRHRVVQKNRPVAILAEQGCRQWKEGRGIFHGGQNGSWLREFTISLQQIYPLVRKTKNSREVG